MTSTPASPQLRSIHRQVRFATARVILALILREMTTTYGRKPGGYIWSIVEPVAGIALLCWIFISLGMRTPALGTNFAIFYATGLLPLYLFTNVSGKVAQALNYSRALLAYPRVTIVDALAARALLAMLTQLMVAYLVIAGILMFQETGTMLELNRIVLGFAMGAALGLGIGLLNCVLFTAWPIWQSAWGMVTRPLMLVSGVPFLIDDLPQPWHDYALWNPLVHIISEVRSGFYHGYTPDYVSAAYVFGLSLGAGALGLLFLWRFHRDLLER